MLRAAGYPTGHSAAQVNADHLAADLVVALDTGHERELAHLGVPTERRRLLRSFDPEADGESVPDPYYGDQEDFELVRDQIEAAFPTYSTGSASEPEPGAKFTPVRATDTVDVCED